MGGFDTPQTNDGTKERLLTFLCFFFLLFLSMHLWKMHYPTCHEQSVSINTITTAADGWCRTAAQMFAAECRGLEN